MERISGDETDLFLLQAEERSRRQKGTAGAGGTTERRSLPGFTAWLPDDFVQAGRERAAGIFWSRERPELVFVSRERGAAIAFRVLEESGGTDPGCPGQAGRQDCVLQCRQGRDRGGSALAGI